MDPVDEKRTVYVMFVSRDLFFEVWILKLFVVDTPNARRQSSSRANPMISLQGYSDLLRRNLRRLCTSNLSVPESYYTPHHSQTATQRTCKHDWSDERQRTKEKKKHFFSSQQHHHEDDSPATTATRAKAEAAAAANV
jgi:hypothetical protein